MASMRKKMDNLRQAHLLERYMFRRSRSLNAILGCHVEFQNEITKTLNQFEAPKTGQKICVFDQEVSESHHNNKSPETFTVIAQEFFGHEELKVKSEKLATSPADFSILIQRNFADASNILFYSLRYLLSDQLEWNPIKWGHWSGTLTTAQNLQLIRSRYAVDETFIEAVSNIHRCIQKHVNSSSAVRFSSDGIFAVVRIQCENTDSLLLQILESQLRVEAICQCKRFSNEDELCVLIRHQSSPSLNLSTTPLILRFHHQVRLSQCQWKKAG